MPSHSMSLLHAFCSVTCAEERKKPLLNIRWLRDLNAQLLPSWPSDRAVKSRSLLIDHDLRSIGAIPIIQLHTRKTNSMNSF